MQTEFLRWYEFVSSIQLSAFGCCNFVVEPGERKQAMKDRAKEEWWGV